MLEFIITEKDIREFEEYLRLEEKSRNTIDKYIRDVTAFWTFIGTKNVTKEIAIKYKEKLLSDNYAVSSIILEYRNIEQTCNSVRFYNSLIIQHQI